MSFSICICIWYLCRQIFPMIFYNRENANCCFNSKVGIFTTSTFQFCKNACSSSLHQALKYWLRKFYFVKKNIYVLIENLESNVGYCAFIISVPEWMSLADKKKKKVYIKENEKKKNRLYYLSSVDSFFQKNGIQRERNISQHTILCLQIELQQTYTYLKNTRSPLSFGSKGIHNRARS